MKQLINAIIVVLAINFLALAGGTGWLVKTHKLDREKILAIKEIIFPKPTEPGATTQPSEQASPTTQPILRLEDLLTKAAGRSAFDQVEFVRHAFDQQMVELDRRESDLKSLQRQIDAAQQALIRDRAAVNSQKTALETREQEAARLAGDLGFQDSLALYSKLPPKQVKSIFMGLDDATVMSYLQTMPEKVASKIIREFKAPDETDRILRIMERMRTAQQASIAKP